MVAHYGRSMPHGEPAGLHAHKQHTKRHPCAQPPPPFTYPQELACTYPRINPCMCDRLVLRRIACWAASLTPPWP